MTTSDDDGNEENEFRRGESNPQAWGLVVDFLPYHDVMNVAAVNRFFLNHVLPCVRNLCLYNSSELHVSQAKRFRHGTVQRVDILCLFQKDRQLKDGRYNNEAAVRSVPFLLALNQTTLQTVLFGVHTLSNRPDDDNDDANAWLWETPFGGRCLASTRKNEVVVLRPYGQDMSKLVKNETSLRHHCTLMQSIYANIQGGALSRQIRWLHLVNSWKCPRRARFDTMAHQCQACLELWNTLVPLDELKLVASKLCLPQSLLTSIFFERFLRERIVPSMTRDTTMDGEQVILLDSNFVSSLVKHRNIVARHAPSLTRMVRNLPNRIHSKLTLGQWLRLDSQGLTISSKHFVVVLRTRTNLPSETTLQNLEKRWQESPSSTTTTANMDGRFFALLDDFLLTHTKGSMEEEELQTCRLLYCRPSSVRGKLTNDS